MNIDLKSISRNIKNLFPYLFLIGIYFFFVNIEARKDSQDLLKINRINENSEQNDQSKSKYSDINLKISIPVIPYKE